MGNNVRNADNQQATLPQLSAVSLRLSANLSFAGSRKQKAGGRVSGASETTRRAPFDRKVIEIYLQGALHDATFSHNNRFRFSQKGIEWLLVLKNLLRNIGFTSWVYREGKTR